MSNFFSFLKDKVKEGFDKRSEENKAFLLARRDYNFQHTLNAEDENRKRIDEKFRQIQLKKLESGTPKERRIAMARLNAMENPLDPSSEMGKLQNYTRRNIVRREENLEKNRMMKGGY